MKDNQEKKPDWEEEAKVYLGALIVDGCLDDVQGDTLRKWGRSWFNFIRSLLDSQREAIARDVEAQKIDESQWPAPVDGFGYGNKAIDKALKVIRNHR
jgi:hypothetical protein